MSTILEVTQFLRVIETEFWTLGPIAIWSFFIAVTCLGLYIFWQVFSAWMQGC
jgi:hypothetical protein